MKVPIQFKRKKKVRKDSNNTLLNSGYMKRED